MACSGRSIHWLRQIEMLAPGDACEVKGSASNEWVPGVVIVNGMAGYWKVQVINRTPAPGNIAVAMFEALAGVVRSEEGGVWSPYIEQVRLPGQTEAWPR